MMRIIRTRLAVAIVMTVACCAAPASADPSAFPSLPPGVANNPFVQSVMNAFGGVLQTTNGPNAYGTITYFRRFDLQLQTAPSVYRSIHLHQGTVINPRGLTLAPGMSVRVSGTPQSDGSLDADIITFIR